MHKAATGWSIRSPAGCSSRQGNRLVLSFILWICRAHPHPCPYHEITPHSFEFSLSRNQTDLAFSLLLPQPNWLFWCPLFFTFIASFLSCSLAPFFKMLSILNMQHDLLCVSENFSYISSRIDCLKI